MRILAYGGNAYKWRLRIGIWPELPPGFLNEKNSIAEGLGPSFGVVFDGSEPCLLYRELLQPNDRGGYPFTLMIEPGAFTSQNGVWRRARWNVALLLDCLMDRVGQWREELLNPDNLTVSDFERMFDEVLQSKRMALHAQEEDAKLLSKPGKPGEDWLSLLSGSFLVDGITIVGPRSIGLPARPNLQDVASWTNQVPQGVRLGRGWMVGGVGAYASALGVGVLLDDEPPPANSDPSSVIERGRKVWQFIEELAQQPDTAERMRRFLIEPSLNWAEVRNTLEDAESYVRPEEAIAASAQTRRNSLKDDAIMTARRNASKGIKTQKLQTKFLLEYCINLQIPLESDLLDYLDEDEVVAALDGEGVPPKRSASLKLSPNFALKMCNRKLACVSEVTPLLVNELRSFLRDEGASGKENALLDAAFDRLQEPKESLLSWWPPPQDEKLASRLAKECARRLADLPLDPWRLADAVFSLGSARVLQELESRPQALDKACYALIATAKHAAGSGPLIDWLNHLANSPLREKLSFKTKFDIAELATEGWDSFTDLVGAMKGQHYAPVATSPEMRKLLLHECGQLFDDILSNRLTLVQTPPNPEQAPPNLVDVDRTLNLDAKCMEKLRMLARRDPASFGVALEHLNRSRSATVNQAAEPALPTFEPVVVAVDVPSDTGGEVAKQPGRDGLLRGAETWRAVEEFTACFDAASSEDLVAEFADYDENRWEQVMELLWMTSSLPLAGEDIAVEENSPVWYLYRITWTTVGAFWCAGAIAGSFFIGVMDPLSWISYEKLQLVFDVVLPLLLLLGMCIVPIPFRLRIRLPVYCRIFRAVDVLNTTNRKIFLDRCVSVFGAYGQRAFWRHTPTQLGKIDLALLLYMSANRSRVARGKISKEERKKESKSRRLARRILTELGYTE